MERRTVAYGGRLLFSVAAVLLTGFVAVVHARPALATAPTHLRVVTDNNYPPFLFLGSDGKPQGYEVDMWHLFEAHTGIKVDLVPMQWSKAQQALLSGKADVIDMIYRTPQRESRYAFSTPYAKHSVAIYTARQIHGVHDVASLRGFPVAVEKGDACAEKLGAQGVTNLRMFANYKDIIEATVHGNVRIFCMDEDPANYYLYRYSALSKFSKAFVLYSGQLRRAVRRDNPALLRVVEHGMSLITPAEHAQLVKRWLQQPLFMTPYIHMAWIAAAIVGALILLMVLWVWMLRRSVAHRTRALREEKDKLRTLLDAIPDGMYVKDRNGVYLDCNEHIAALIGVDREQLIGHTEAQVLRPAEAELVQAIDAEVMRTGEQRAHVFAPSERNGQRAIEIIKVPMRGPDGSIHGVLSLSRDITERVQTDERLRLWSHLFQHAAFALAIFDVRTRTIVTVNPVFAERRGYTQDELVGQSVDVLYPKDLVAERQQARNDIDRREHSLLETEHVTQGGGRFPVLLDISVTHGADGAPQYVIEYAKDITDRRNAEGELRLAAVAFESQAALVVMDTEGVIRRTNRAFTEFTGYAPADVIDEPATMLTTRFDQQESILEIQDHVKRDGSWQGERWVDVKHGAPRVVRASLYTVRDERGTITHYVYAMVDMTGEREARASVDHMTFFDPLTDLPNRRFVRDRMQQVLDSGDPATGAFLIVDLDHFKRINDLRGHAAGDQLLCLVARRLRKVLDTKCVLSRFSGGMFALLVPITPDQTAIDFAMASHYAKLVAKALREPFVLGEGMSVTLTASVGWTVMNDHHESPEAVFKEAELAMYGAKAQGRNQACRFDPTMQIDLARREALVDDLREATSDQSLSLHLQAQTDRQGRVTSAEALLRWTRPCGERVSPEVFIPLAEDNGLIIPIGNWVLRHACEILVTWSAEPLTQALSLAVNVSARQFAQADYVDTVRDIVAATGADPARLKLELTESTIVGNVADAAAKLAELRTMGICISLDDFGTGYSSLAYLSQLPLDQLKIDKSFVVRLPQHANDAMVAQTVIGIGHGLGLEVIAEGVESAAQRQFLMAHGCDAFQGYLIARPLPIDAFEAMLDDRVTVARLHRATTVQTRVRHLQRHATRPHPPTH